MHPRDLLEKGVVRMMGDPSTVAARYQNFLDRDASNGRRHTDCRDAGYVWHKPAFWRCKPGRTIRWVLRWKYTVRSRPWASRWVGDQIPPLPSPVVGVTVHSSDGRPIASSSTQGDGLVLERDPAGRGTVTIEFPNIPPLKGEYYVGVYLLSEDSIHIYDSAANVATLHISQKTLEQGIVSLPHRW